MSEQLSLALDQSNVINLEVVDPSDQATRLCTEVGSEDPADKKEWVWSLKAGDCYVSFKKPLQLEAFHLLSSDRNCMAIEAQPLSHGFPYEDIAWYRFVIGTRSFDGKECLWGVEMTSDLRPDGDGGLRPSNWHLVQEWARRTGKHCDFLRESDIFENRRLIENWKWLMIHVQKAHEDPDEGMREEICALAEHPEGISIEQIAFLVDAHPDTVFSQICWLIHQNKLLTDLSRKPLNHQYIVHSTRVH